MSKATTITSTATLATTPASPPPSRRRLLAGSGLATIAAAVGLPAVVATAVSDPVVGLYAQWRANADALATSTERFCALSAAAPGRSQALDENNALCDRDLELTDAIMETPATTAEGIRCKMLVGLEVWKFIERPGVTWRYENHMTVAFMRDAVRVLGAGAVA